MASDPAGRTVAAVRRYVDNGQRVGLNRPDLQFDFQGRRYYVEYDSPASGRGLGHQSRLTSNDPDGETILIIIP